MADTPVQDPVVVYDSILLSVKKWCNLPADYVPFEDDVITCINAELNVLNQVGVGVTGFQIVDATSKWIDFLGSDETKFGMAKQYVKIKTRLIFDPPANSFVLDALKKQADEMIWRANVQAEGSFEESTSDTD